MKNINFNRMMNKYIDAEKLKESLKKHYTDITVPVITAEGGLESYFRRSEIKDTIKLIDSLQQEQPIIEKDWVEKRKQECGYRRLSDNGNYQCERYEGNFGPCDGRCSWIVDYPKLKELKEMKQQEVDLEKEIHKKVLELHTAPCYDELASFAHYFIELGQKDAANKFDEIEYNRQRAEEEMFDKTLDEAAWKYAEKEAAKKVDKNEFNDYILHHIFDGEALYTGFKEGAKWQKEKLMKKSMRMYKCYDEEDNLVGFSTDYDAPGAYGNLVNIVILNTKEEDK